MAELTVAAGVAGALVDLASAKGADRAALTRRARIDPAELAHPDRRVPFDRYIALMRAARELSGDPALALHFGEAFELSDLSIVGFLDAGVDTVADGLGLLNRYGSLVVEVGAPGVDRFVLERHANVVWLVDTRPNPNAFPELTESTFARIACMTRRFFGERQFLKQARMTHPAPEYLEEYERIFQVPVVFDADTNALGYDASWLDQKVATGPRYVSGILGAHAEELLKQLEKSKSMRGRVERLLVSRLMDGSVDMDTIAAELGVGRQTLLRRLKAEGATFARVLDDLRRATALHYLRAGTRSVSEIAYLVGFSEPAAFSRAFRRWTGNCPRTFVAGRLMNRSD